jgi:hypothetical protein
MSEVPSRRLRLSKKIAIRLELVSFIAMGNRLSCHHAVRIVRIWSEQGTHRMKSVLYVSVADMDLETDAVHDIVSHSQRRNLANGITGIMLYNGSNFLQLIEGEDAIIDACYARIQRDTRHSGVATLREDIITVREFPAWAMRYSLVEQPAENTLNAVREAGAPRADTLDRIAAFVGLNRRGR